MTIPSDDNALLRELELTVSEELSVAETGRSEEEAASLPASEWLSDPADDERYEVGLGSLIGAVEALEDGPSPFAHLPATEVPDGFGPSNGTEG